MDWAVKKITDKRMAIALVIALCFWVSSFMLTQWTNFWASMACAAIVLTAISVYWGGAPYRREQITLRSVVLGIGSGVVLYGIFFLGDILAKIILPFAQGQVSQIYTIRSEAEALIIALILFFVTSPGEEIFWRGFVQRWSMDKWGAYPGMFVAAAIYGGVHIVSGNFMLIMAAFVAGLYWGYMYLKEGDLVAVTISHAVWTVAIFIVFPIMGY